MHILQGDSVHEDSILQCSHRWLQKRWRRAWRRLLAAILSRHHNLEHTEGTISCYIHSYRDSRHPPDVDRHWRGLRPIPRTMFASANRRGAISWRGSSSWWFVAMSLSHTTYTRTIHPHRIFCRSFFPCPNVWGGVKNNLSPSQSFLASRFSLLAAGVVRFWTDDCHVDSIRDQWPSISCDGQTTVQVFLAMSASWQWHKIPSSSLASSSRARVERPASFLSKSSCPSRESAIVFCRREIDT